MATQASTTDKATSFLDKIVGSEGLKTDVTVRLSKDTYFYIGVAVFIPIFIILLLNKFVVK